MKYYDKTKDILICKEEVIPTDLYICMYQYKGGEYKIAIQKTTVIKNKDTGKFEEVLTNRVGRMDLEVAKVLNKKLVKMLKEYYEVQKPGVYNCYG